MILNMILFAVNLHCEAKYVSIYVCICTYLYKYLLINVCMYIYLYVYTRVDVYICDSECVIRLNCEAM